MKKLTRRGFTAAGILAALGAGLTSLAGCDFDLVGCTPATLYGPPPDYDPDDNEIVDVYGPPDVDPSDWDDPSTWDDPKRDDGVDGDDDDDDDGDDGDDDDYDPASNIEPPVYGPPADDPDYDPDDNIAITLYGPPATDDYEIVDDYDPEENYPTTLYGVDDDFSPFD